MLYNKEIRLNLLLMRRTKEMEKGYTYFEVFRYNLENLNIKVISNLNVF